MYVYTVVFSGIILWYNFIPPYQITIKCSTLKLISASKNLCSWLPHLVWTPNKISLVICHFLPSETYIATIIFSSQLDYIRITSTLVGITLINYLTITRWYRAAEIQLVSHVMMDHLDWYQELDYHLHLDLVVILIVALFSEMTQSKSQQLDLQELQPLDHLLHHSVEDTFLNLPYPG